MRVLVVGTTPPGGGVFGRALALRASERREAGDDVEICSPDPESAAHLTANLDGVLLAARLGWLSRRFDAIELRIEPGVPCHATTNRLARAVYLVALGAALRRYGEVTLRLDTPVPIPGGLGGRAAAPMWAAADHVVVWNEEDEAMAVRTPGVRPGAVEIARRVPGSASTEHGWPDATTVDLRAKVLEVVRERATRDRRVIAGRALVGAPPATTERARVSSLVAARVIGATLARRTARALRQRIR